MLRARSKLCRLMLLAMLLMNFTGCGTQKPTIGIDGVCLMLAPLDLSPADRQSLSPAAAQRVLKYECWYAKNCEGLQARMCP